MYELLEGMMKDECEGGMYENVKCLGLLAFRGWVPVMKDNLYIS